MALNFEPPPSTLKDTHWRPTNQWRPRSLTSAARARYLTTKMEAEPSPRDPSAAVLDASFVATQLARRDVRGEDLTRVHNSQALKNGMVPHCTSPQKGPGEGQRDQEKDRAGPEWKRHDTAGSHQKTGSDQADRKTASWKTGHRENGPRNHQVGQEKTAQGNTEDRAGQEDRGPRREQGMVEHKTAHSGGGGQDRTGHRTGHRRGGGQTGTVRLAQKQTLQPSVLTLGQNGPDRVRVMPRCHSAGPAVLHLGRSSGSPYLEDQQVSISVQHRQPQRHHSGPHGPHRRHLHSQGGKERREVTNGYSALKSTNLHSTAKFAAGPNRRHSADDTSPSSRRHSSGGGERIGRCQTGAPVMPFYKAALVLMQAQRLRTSAGRFSPSPSSTSTYSSSSPITSPRDSVFYLPPPPPPPRSLPAQQGRQQDCVSPQQDGHHHHHHHQPIRFHPKSILRPPPPPSSSPFPGHRDRPARRNASPPSPRSPPPSQPRSAGSRVQSVLPSGGSLSVTPRKRVTFGSNVIVQLKPHVGVMGRVLSSTV